ncbi:MAG: hypothetical protein LBB45_06545 [Methanobrevibacter sp.]|nr:hypothetical protein [Candidatus Methanovirga basalitermitum]
MTDPQQKASNAITKAYEKFKNVEPSSEGKKGNKFLLDALPRFGKCITTYDFINRNDIKKTLILTHKPVVEDS